MKPHQININKQQKILEEAATRRTPIVLSYKSMEEWLTFKSHFAADVSDDGSLLIAYPVNTDHTASEIISGQNVDITFRWGNKKILFNTDVAGRYRDPSHSMPILKLHPPNTMYEHQRRIYERIAAPKGMKITADLWIEKPNSDRSQSSAIIRGIIMDISAGGISIAVPNEQKQNCNVGDTVVCSFNVEMGRSPAIIYSQFRRWQETDKDFGIMGLQFTGLKATQQGQAQLERVLKLIKRFKQASKKPFTNHL